MKIAKYAVVIITTFGAFGSAALADAFDEVCRAHLAENLPDFDPDVACPCIKENASERGLENLTNAGPDDALNEEAIAALEACGVPAT